MGRGITLDGFESGMSSLSHLIEPDVDAKIGGVFDVAGFARNDAIGDRFWMAPLLEPDVTVRQSAATGIAARRGRSSIIQ